MSVYTMDFSKEGLFRIGEVAKCCGVDRQTILFYEKCGLMTHSAVNESSGYRYYSAEDVAGLLFILRLRKAGVSLGEIGGFIREGGEAAVPVIESMERQLRDILEGLAVMRALSVGKEDYQVSWQSLPAMRCYVREHRCAGVEEATERMYGVFREAMELGLPVRDLFAEYPEERGGALRLDGFLLRVCVEVEGQDAPGCVDYPAVSCASLCYRGGYGEMGAAYEKLWSCVREKGLRQAGSLREQYLDSRRRYSDNADRYVTRILVPVEDRRG